MFWWLWERNKWKETTFLAYHPLSRPILLQSQRSPCLALPRQLYLNLKESPKGARDKGHLEISLLLVCFFIVHNQKGLFCWSRHFIYNLPNTWTSTENIFCNFVLSNPSKNLYNVLGMFSFFIYLSSLWSWDSFWIVTLASNFSDSSK